MRRILLDLKSFIKSDFNKWTYGYLVFFLVVTIGFNYWVDFEDRYLNSNFGKPENLFQFLLFYAIGYYGIAVPQLYLLRRSAVLKSSAFWGRSFFFIFLIAFSAFFHFHRYFYSFSFNIAENRFVISLLGQMECIVSIILPLLFFWMWIDKKNGNFYGISFRKVNLVPYFIMLIGMSVLIFTVSFESSFQEVYPVFKPWTLEPVFNWADWQKVLVFEPFYGMSFFSVELVFRGALIIGMAKVLGKDALLPMVSVYAFLHFGKPFEETLGSIFGAYILGVIALRSNHILGGVVIHVGVAYLMELAALWQHYR